jgi:hypothetical protein
MLDIAMRVETQSGNSTNAASENSSVFDTRIAVGVATEEDGLEEVCTDKDERPALSCSRGAFLWLPEYTYNLYDSPNTYKVSSIRKGMYADNPTGLEDIPSVTERLIRGGATAPEIATLLGRDAIERFLDELNASEDQLTAQYIRRAALIALNYAQRDIPQDTTVVE